MDVGRLDEAAAATAPMTVVRTILMRERLPAAWTRPSAEDAALPESTVLPGAAVAATAAGAAPGAAAESAAMAGALGAAGNEFESTVAAAAATAEAAAGAAAIVAAAGVAAAAGAAGVADEADKAAAVVLLAPGTRTVSDALFDVLLLHQDQEPVRYSKSHRF